MFCKELPQCSLHLPVRLADTFAAQYSLIAIPLPALFAFPSLTFDQEKWWKQ